MPLQYTGVLDEHRAVRTAAGVFDVSHLGRFEVIGPNATKTLRSQLCNDITKVEPGRAQYTMALNDGGGVEDDIIVWRLEDDRYWVMPNGTNSDDILARFSEAAGSDTAVRDIRSETTLLAVQGPEAPDIVERVLGAKPGRFRVAVSEAYDTTITAAGTGYTGERGAEICISNAHSGELWDALLEAGADPCGLGARDTLRLEMGFPLWGQDLSPSISPLEAGLAWVVDWNHDFVGKAALEAQRHNVPRRLVAFTTEGRAIPRPGYEVTSETGSGVVTSGNFSPTLEHGIGLALIAPPPDPSERLDVTIRGKQVPAEQADLPFIEK